MIKIKYIFDFLIFSLKRRYFGYKKTIVLGGSPSIETLSPLLENINNCGKKTKKNKKKQKKTEKKTKNKNKKNRKKQRYLENYKDLEAHIFRLRFSLFLKLKKLYEKPKLRNNGYRGFSQQFSSKNFSLKSFCLKNCLLNVQSKTSLSPIRRRVPDIKPTGLQAESYDGL